MCAAAIGVGGEGGTAERTTVEPKSGWSRWILHSVRFSKIATPTQTRWTLQLGGPARRCMHRVPVIPSTFCSASLCTRASTLCSPPHCARCTEPNTEHTIWHEREREEREEEREGWRERRERSLCDEHRLFCSPSVHLSFLLSPLSSLPPSPLLPPSLTDVEPALAAVAGVGDGLAGRRQQRRLIRLALVGALAPPQVQRNRHRITLSVNCLCLGTGTGCWW